MLAEAQNAHPRREAPGQARHGGKKVPRATARSHQIRCAECVSKACPAGAWTCGALQPVLPFSGSAMPFPPLFATAVMPSCVRPRIRARASDFMFAIWARMQQDISLRRSGGARCFSTTAVFLVHCQVSQRFCQLSARGEGGRGRAAACGRNRCVCSTHAAARYTAAAR